MNWQPVAGQLAQLGFPILARILVGQIPIVGTLLGGSGEQIGQLIGNAIGKALGVEPNPDAISAAIDGGNTTEVVARLNGIQAESVARWPALAQMTESDATGQVALINASSAAYETRMRVDVASNGPRSTFYRVILNYCATLNMVFLGGLIAYAFVVGGQRLRDVIDASTLILSWSGVLAAILGTHFYTRAREREAALTTTPIAQPATQPGTTAAAVTAAIAATKATPKR